MKEIQFNSFIDRLTFEVKNSRKRRMRILVRKIKVISIFNS